MSNTFIRLTSGWIPVAVMLLFAATLVVGQNRAVSPDVRESSGRTSPLDLDNRARLATLRHIGGSISLFSENVELTIDVYAYPVIDELLIGAGRLD